MKQSLTVFFFFIIGTVRLFAQLPPAFGCPPGSPGAAFCQQACIYCNIDGHQDETNIPITPVQILDDCTFGSPPITLDNPRWYAFVAGTGFIEFSIKASQCFNNAGLEAAIVGSCGPPLKPITCGALDPNNPVIFAFPLIVGNVYWLVVDGVNGDLCKFTIEVTNGSATPPPLGDIGSIEGPTEVCPKALVEYTVPPVQYATSYLWSAPPGSKINGGGNIVFLPAATGTSVNIQFGPVGGLVCVTASSPCDTPKTTCLQVVNQLLPVTNLSEQAICFEELPYVWPEDPDQAVIFPGTYTLKINPPYQSYLGCDSFVQQKIIALPRKAKTLPLKHLCKDECLIVGGFEYCETGTFQEIIPSESGCDSTINFSIKKLEVEAEAEQPDTLTCKITSIVVQGSATSASGNAIVRRWVNFGGQVISFADTAVVTSPGQYFYIASVVGGGLICLDTAFVNVPSNYTPPLANAGPNRVLTCGEPVIQLQGSGSTGSQYTYLWKTLINGNIVSGITTLTPTVNAPGTYLLVVTNQHNGCTQFDVTVVTSDNLQPTATATGGTYTCSSPNVTLQSSTNAVNPTYAWSGPNNFTSGLPNPTVSLGGTYVLTVTDGITGCINVASAIVVANDAPPGATASGGALTCSINSVTLNGASPAPNPVFAWTGPNSFTSALPNPTVSAVGDYLLTVTGENGCTSTASVSVTLNNTPPGATASGGTLTCAINSVTLSGASPASNPIFAWTGPNNFTSDQPNPTASAVGDYLLTVTGGNGCTSTATATVSLNNTPPGATASGGTLSCAINSVTLNGASPASNPIFAWTGPNNFTSDQPNPTATTTGDYLLTVTGENGCTSTATATVSLDNAPPGASLAVAGTLGCDNIPVNLTASSPSPAALTFVWTLPDNSTVSTNNVPNLPASVSGNYTVAVTSAANGCTSTATATVEQTAAVTATIASTNNANCFGDENGSASAIGGGGNGTFSYLWDNNANTADLNNVGAGTYTVTITDGQLCTATATATIGQPAPVAPNATATDETVNGADDGTATANPGGGTPPYSYLWSNNETTASIDSLPDGFYTVVVTDGNGCTGAQTVQVVAGICGLTSAFVVESPACNGDSTGSATIVITGGNAPFTYVWSSGGSGATEPNLPAGIYTVSVTDVNGCDLSDAVEITNPALLIIEVDNVVSTECDQPEGSATVTTAGGTGAIAVTWDNNQTGPTATGLLPGTYTATATDENGCTISIEATVNGEDNTGPEIEYTPVIAPLGSTGVVSLTVQSLGLIVTDTCGIVSEVMLVPTSFNCTQLGDQTVAVTATDNSGNVTMENITVTVVDNQQPTLECPANVTRCFGNNVVQYPAPIAMDNCLGNGGMFALVSGLPSGVPYPSGITTNTYTYTDAGGNVGACSFDVTILTVLSVALDTVIDDIANQGIGAINITVGGSQAPYTFVWVKDGDTLSVSTEDLTNLTAGNYQVFITDNNGCSAASEAFTVDNLVGTDDPDWATGLLIVPNPTSGRLSVIFSEKMNDDVHLKVYDATGRLVRQQMSASPKRVDMDLSALPDGLYSLLLRVNDQVLTRKIVVSK